MHKYTIASQQHPKVIESFSMISFQNSMCLPWTFPKNTLRRRNTYAGPGVYFRLKRKAVEWLRDELNSKKQFLYLYMEQRWPVYVVGETQ